MEYSKCQGRMRLGVNSMIIGTMLLFTSCSASPIPSLEDVDFEVTLASVDDWTRYEKAMEPIYRAQFAGATYVDAKGHVEAEFKAKDYDANLAYERTRFGPSVGSRMPAWPVLKLKLLTHRLLHDPKSSQTRIGFRFCDPQASKNTRWGILDDFLIWKGQLVDHDRALEIDSALKASAKPQEYEAFLTYVYYADESLKADKTVTLLPLPSDLCVSLARPSGFESFEYGPPKRLDKNIVNKAVGDLPRSQPTQ